MMRRSLYAVMIRLGLVSGLGGILAGGSLGCGKKQEDPGPSCEKLTDHVFAITTKAYPGHGDMAMGNRKDYIAACEARKMPAEERRCMLAAQDMAGLGKCRKLPAGEPPGGKAPAPAAPAPAGSAPAPAGP